MGQYASKAVAGTGLGLSIGSLGYSLLQNGALGNLFGNNQANQYTMQLQAENSMLKAENYSDKNSKEVFIQSQLDNNALRTEILAYIEPLVKDSVENKVALARLEERQKCCCEKQELQQQNMVCKINEVALTTKGQFDLLNQTLQCMANTLNTTNSVLNSITKTVVPINAVCPLPATATTQPTTSA